MVYEIKSNQNQKYKLVKSLLLKKNRQKNKLFTVEGIKSVKDAMSSNTDIQMIFMSESLYAENSFKTEDISTYVVPDYMFDALCDTDAPQGVLAVISMKDVRDIELNKDKLYIYCDSVSDPGNLGTILRTADAVGFDGVLLSENCADLYSPKVIRSSMGSFFHIKVYEKVTLDDLNKLKKDGFLIYCGALGENTISYTKADYKKPNIIVVGNEANGISDSVLNIADQCIKIPILGEAESLNVGVAAAVIMYEAQRQRNVDF